MGLYLPNVASPLYPFPSAFLLGDLTGRLRILLLMLSPGVVIKQMQFECMLELCLYTRESVFQHAINP